MPGSITVRNAMDMGTAMTVRHKKIRPEERILQTQLTPCWGQGLDAIRNGSLRQRSSCLRLHYGYGSVRNLNPVQRSELG